jgi:hypothetical protein
MNAMITTLVRFGLSSVHIQRIMELTKCYQHLNEIDNPNTIVVIEATVFHILDVSESAFLLC